MKKIKNFHSLLLVAFSFISLLSISNPAQAKVFRNSYVSFELPNRWDCYLENTAWVCRYALSKSCIGPGASTKVCQEQRRKTQEAIIILAAKEVGPKDSLQAYYKHLKTPRSIVTPKGQRSTSKIIHVKQSKVESQPWMDGMHLSSEIPHYYTRYLATVKGNIAVLVTFSAHKLFYTKYSSEFFRAIKSLRVIATKSQSVNKRELHTGVGTLGDNINVHMTNAIDEANQGFDGEDQGDSGNLDTYLLIAAALLALLGFFIWFKGRR